MANILETLDINHSFDKDRVMRFPNIQLEKGESKLILGSSGIGKSTLLHVLGGLLKPTSGRVNFMGKSLYELSTKQLDQLRGKQIGIIFQKPHFMQSLTAIENLKLSNTISGGKSTTSQVYELAEQLNIQSRLQAFPHELSQGELQRLSICRAFLKKPAMILADEPTSALDDGNTAQVVNQLQSLQQTYDTALLIVTHDARLKNHQFHTIELGAE